MAKSKGRGNKRKGTFENFRKLLEDSKEVIVEILRIIEEIIKGGGVL